MHNQVYKIFVLLVISLHCISGYCQEKKPEGNPLFNDWERKELIPGGRLDAIAWLGDGVIITGSRMPNPGNIFRSEDNGITWTPMQNIAQGEQKDGITCLADGGEGVAYALTQNSAFWRSEDDGKTWTHLTTLTTNQNKDGYTASYSIMVTQQGTVLVSDTDSSGGHVYRSTDQGESWTNVGRISDDALYRFTEVGKGIIVNGWDGKVYRSTDDGLHWMASEQLEDTALFATEYLGGGNIIQATQSGHVFKGNAWDLKDWKNVGKPGEAADDFTYLGYSAVIYSTYTMDMSIFLSLDMGETWQNIGNTGTQVKGDWLDHFITIPTSESVICIGGTSKGFVLRAEISRDSLYKHTMSSAQQKLIQQSSGNIQFKNALVSQVFDYKELNEPEDILIDGDYAYIPSRDGNNLAVFDISDPKELKLVSSFRDPELLDAMGVDKYDDIIYLTSLTNHKLLILDGSDPRHLKKISSIEVGGEGVDEDRLRKVLYHDGYVYLTHSSEGKLYICDVSDPSQPQMVSSLATGDGAFAVFIKDNYAYVGGCFEGSSLKVIDISHKKSPKLVKTLSDKERFGCLCSFQNMDNILYAVAYSSNALVTIDISDPENAFEIGYLTSDLLNGPGRLVVEGNTAYVINSINDSFALIDVSYPQQPRLVHTLTDRWLDKVYGLAIHNGNIYLAGRDARSLVVLKRDQIKPDETNMVGFIRDTLDIDAPEDILIRKDIAYIPCRDGASLTLIDVADPETPKILSTFSDPEISEAMGLDVHNDLLFLTSWTNHTLLILDIKNPKDIKKISSLKIGNEGATRDRLRKVVFRDDYLFLTHSNEGSLYIVDINDPRKPEIISSVATGDGAFNVFLKDNYAYVIGCYPGSSLNVIDITNVHQPTLVQTLKSDSTYSCLCSLSTSGNYLYGIAFTSKTFIVFDVSDPTHTKEVAIIKDERLNGANRLYQHENSIFIATALTDGMVQIDVSDPLQPKITNMVSSHILDKAYGITYNDGLVYVVGRDADSMVIIKPQEIIMSPDN